MFKKIIFIFIFIFGFALNASPLDTSESEQEMGDFSLAGYGEKGKKIWDLAGKSAQIFTDVVKLEEIVGNLYEEDEDIRLTARRGDFFKTENRLHLEEDVLITTSSGAKLATEALDWDRKNNLIFTKAKVSIEKDNLLAQAQGAQAQPDLSQVTLEKEVEVQILPKEEEQIPSQKSKIIITCDGKLVIDYQNNLATFNDNVKVERDDLKIYSDIMDIYFIPEKGKETQDKDFMALGGRIKKIVARGNVKIMRQENISYSDEAIYDAQDRKITLSGRPKLIIESFEELKDASSGD